jgi:hypothetical protein
MGKIRWQEVVENDQIVIKEIHKVRVHAFNMGDVEDPEIYAGAAIYDWQQTDSGKFIMAHGKDHTYSIAADYNTYGYKCVITCEIDSKKLSEYYLKWGKPV